jgi:hypothetical protein
MDNKPKSDSISLNQSIKNTMTEYLDYESLNIQTFFPYKLENRDKILTRFMHNLY